MQGEGAMNTVGGLKPDTVQANLTGPLQGFWGLLTEVCVRVCVRA